MSIWSFPYADTINEPLVDAWWIPGFTSQAPGYIYASNPLLSNGPGFPTGLTYVTVGGNYYDTSANPLSGYLTFGPSSPLTFNINGVNTYMPQRYAGLNFSLLGVNQMGDGKIYLQYGKLLVSLLATDNANMTPANFTYHVRENFTRGNQYDISVPSADSSTVQDIRNLIIPGTIKPVTDDNTTDDCVTSIPVTSTQWVSANVVDGLPGASAPSNLTPYPVYMAFKKDNSIPSGADWQVASWASTTTNANIAQLLVGPGAGGYSLPIGYYRVGVQVNATPQQVQLPVGFLNIYGAVPC